MVAGDIRFGAIASFICDENRYLLANFFQENLKYVKPEQLVEESRASGHCSQRFARPSS